MKTHSGRRPEGGLAEVEAITVLQRGLQAGSTFAKNWLGIGDDAAILTSQHPLVWSIDDSVEGIHFDLDWLALPQAAARAFNAAASDLAAMGATPLGALCSLQWREPLSASTLRAIARAQAGASRKLQLPMLGGNCTRGAELRFTTTVLGQCSRPLRRRGARPGHGVFVVGDLGHAHCGLLWLQRHGSHPPRTAGLRRCVTRWRQPRALLSEGQELSPWASSCIDLSDGLASDGRQLANSSNVALHLNAERLEALASPALTQAATELEIHPREAMLLGGEDYGLLCTGPVRSAPACAQRIGTVRKGRPEVWLHQANEEPRTLPLGFQH